MTPPAVRRKRGVEADDRHHDKRQPGDQNRLQQAEVQLLTQLTDLEKADRDRHGEDEQRRDQDPEVVRLYEPHRLPEHGNTITPLKPAYQSCNNSVRRL